MLGSSRLSLAALQASLDDRRSEPGFAAMSGELLAVARILGEQKSLRNALADAGQPVQVRTGIATSLFGSQLSPLAMAVLSDVAAARWSNDADLVEALEQIGAQVAFISADTDGTLDRIENELFTFGRAVEQSPELQLALTDPAVASDRKGELIRNLVGPTATPTTTALLTHMAANLRNRRPAAAIGSLSTLASAQRNQTVAEVRSAITLNDDQNTRLAAALTSMMGRQVRLNVVVDPDVLGGIVVRIGDDVIDGSIASRLDQARRAILA
ncbi:MAG: F0F1 ATP synthase subunit delta [Actinomycetes bacterium]|jgi:F-type H+-transporting ATPase subunit delta